MKKILFPTAYAESAKNTWRYTLRLAQHFGAQITLMHVYEDASVLLSGGLEEEMLENFEHFNVNQLQDERIRLKDFASVNTPKQYHALAMNFLVTAGNEAKAICRESQENDYDLIVLSTNTSSHFSDTFLGSTSLKVLAQADTPVFLVPPMAKYQGINRIIYATNFESGDLAAIRYLIDWVHAFRAKLHLLHVTQKANVAEQSAERMQKMMQIFEEAHEAGTLTFDLLKGNIVQSIREYLRLTDSDMIALTTHKRGFFAQLFNPSVSNQIVKKVKVPVLIFK